jgi:hypothetical protein
VVGLARIDQPLAVQLQRADLGVDEALDLVGTDPDLVVAPHPPELLTASQEQIGQVGGAGLGAAEGDEFTQPCGVHPRQERVFLRRVDLAGGGVGEPPVPRAARGSRVPRGVPGQRDAHRRLPQGLAELAGDLGGGVVQAVEHTQEPGADVLVGRAPGRRVVSGQAEQVVALVDRHVQPLGDRGEHPLRGLGAAFPLQTGVVVGRHVAQRRDLLAPQPVGPAALSARQTHVLRLQCLTPAAEELRQPGAIDHDAPS